jgi:hypothetical protein
MASSCVNARRAVTTQITGISKFSKLDFVMKGGEETGAAALVLLLS